jgi:uncharacterized membrane protein YkvA (DUF1232 family)
MPLLAAASSDRSSSSQALRLLPDLLRLLRRLAGDRSLPRGVRVRLWLLLAYLPIPIDVVPDVIPVLGYADDAIVVTAVLRSVVRRAAPSLRLKHLTGHWIGFGSGRPAALLVSPCAAVCCPPAAGAEPSYGGGVVLVEGAR